MCYAILQVHSLPVLSFPGCESEMICPGFGNEFEEFWIQIINNILIHLLFNFLAGSGTPGVETKIQDPAGFRFNHNSGLYRSSNLREKTNSKKRLFIR